jgi:hypothetical protein
MKQTALAILAIVTATVTAFGAPRLNMSMST